MLREEQQERDKEMEKKKEEERKKKAIEEEKSLERQKRREKNLNKAKKDIEEEINKIHGDAKAKQTIPNADGVSNIKKLKPPNPISPPPIVDKHEKRESAMTTISKSPA